jgi:hypothetical protein
MALPKIDTPIYDLELPVSKKKIKFRPFLVKEQKNLLMAMESDDSESIENNIKQILQNCTLTKKLNIENLPIVDIEFYFLNLRARSVGEVVENKYKCENEVEGQKCGNIMETSLNLLDIKVDMPETADDEIELTSKISMKMKYPEFSVVEQMKKVSNPADLAFEMIVSSIDYIYDGEQIYYAKETSREELTEFVESLNAEQFAKVEKFFENVPKLNKKIELKCSKCGFEHSFDVEGLESFFV